MYRYAAEHGPVVTLYRDGNYKLINNRLNYVMDFMPANAYTVDIDNQSANNYKYDKTGNLISDVATGMKLLPTASTGRCTVRIASIKKSAGTTSYGHDARQPGKKAQRHQGVRRTRKCISFVWIRQQFFYLGGAALLAAAV